MDWLFLILVVPAVVVPVVLLSGFAGCDIVFGLEPRDPPPPPLVPPATPVALTATAIDLDRILLTWEYMDPPPETVTFQVRRTGGSPLLPQPPPTSEMTQEDTGLDEGTAYFYQVMAIRDFDQVESVLSDPVSASTLEWEPIFTTANITPNPSSGDNQADNCIVQRVNGIAKGGAFVRVTLRGIASQTTVLTAVSVSRAVPLTEPQPWNSADPPKAVTFGGGAVNLSGGGTAVSDKISYPVVQGQDLLLALDVGSASGRILRRPLPGGLAYIGDNRAEAAVMPRTAGYNTVNANAYCIEMIEVA
jgi:hypothetical protein